MSTLLQDIRYALRQLRRAPGFTLTVLLTVALAIGSTAALTGVLRATIWNTLPYKQPGALVSLADRNLKEATSKGLMGVARTVDLLALQHDGHPILQSLAFYYPNPIALTRANHEAQPLLGAGVSGSFFDTAQGTAILGRALTPADDVRTGPVNVVISYGLWQSAFAGDKGVIGEITRLGQDQATIVGVMDRRFSLPRSVDVWYPAKIFPAYFDTYRGDGSRFVNVIARLDPHESVTSATVAITALADRLAAKYPATDADWGFSVSTLRDSLFSNYRRALLLLGAAVALVLFIVVLNIAGLQLARNAARQPEFAVRSALGVTGRRLLQQLLTENLLLMLAGSLLGLALAQAFVRLLLTQLPAALLAVDKPHIDSTVAAICIGIAMLAGLATATLPWVNARRTAQQQPATAAASSRVISSRTQRFSRIFGATQIALALVLLTLTGSVLRELYVLLKAPLGYETAHVQTFTVDRGWNNDMAKQHQFYQAVEDHLNALPGVQSAGAMTALPLRAFTLRATYDIAGKPLTPKHDTVVAEPRNLTPGLLSALRIPLLAGRPLTTRDAEPNAPPVLLVNRAFAQRFFNGQGAVGQHLISLSYDGKSTMSQEIVGIVGDIAGTGGALTTAAAAPETYGPENGGWPHMQFAVRTAGDLPSLESSIRKFVTGLDATASVSHFESLGASVKTAQSQPLLNAELLTLFAAFATVLVTLGIYGLAAFGLTQRGREFAVRMALGSTRPAIASLILRDALRVLLPGLAAGLIVSLLTLKLLTSITVQVAPSAWFYLLAIITLAAAALLAVVVPAWRASHLDPAIALRSE